MMIITLLTIVGKRIKLHLSVWQPAAESRNPRMFCWGLCGHKVFSSRLRDCPTPRALPQQSVLGFFFWHRPDSTR